MARRGSSHRPSRSSLRVAQARSLEITRVDDAISTPRVVTKPVPSTAKETLTSESTGALPRSSEPVDLTSIPRLDRPWVMYDLAGKPFVINPLSPGRVV